MVAIDKYHIETIREPIDIAEALFDHCHVWVTTDEFTDLRLWQILAGLDRRPVVRGDGIAGVDRNDFHPWKLSRQEPGRVPPISSNLQESRWIISSHQVK